MPIFAAGRVCAHSFFDLIQLYFHQHPTALQFWFELTRCDIARIWDGSESLEAANVDPDLGHGGSSTGSSSSSIGSMAKEKDEGDEKQDGSGGGDSCRCGGDGMVLVGECIHCQHHRRRPKQLREIVNEMRSTLDQIPVPKGFVRGRYGGLVHALLEHGIMPLGLYRPAGVGGSTLPFALINPPPTTTLVSTDLIYILRPHETSSSLSK